MAAKPKARRPMLGTPMVGTPRVPMNFESAPARPAPPSDNLRIVSQRLACRKGSGINLAGRCYKAPKRTLEQDYQLTSKVLGTGYSGSVRLARAKRGDANQTVAVKTFKLRGLKAAQRERLLSEIEVFLCMDHPHVARLLKVYETDVQLSLVMECMEGGELFNRIAEAERFTEERAADATRQMLLAVNYLHSQGMVHRDVKLENFLYDLEDSHHLKMIDFGFSKYTDRTARMRTSCGTLAYVAPEVLNRNYTSQCDLWSIGVIVYILLSGQMPFNGHADSEAQIKQIKGGRYNFPPEHWKNVSSEAQGFTSALLQVDPARRLTAKQALEHRWIARNCESVAPQVDIAVMEALASWSKAPKLQRACTSMMAWTLSNKHHAQVRDSFLAIDVDNDGSISPADLRQAMQDNLLVPAEDTEELLAAFEGQNIHYSDFLAAMISSCIDLDDELLKSTFSKFDVGDAGYIDSQALRGVLGDTFEGQKIELLIDEADAEKCGKIDYTQFADYARAYHPGTLLIKSGASCDQEQADQPQAGRNEVALGARQRNQQCCVVQ